MGQVMTLCTSDEADDHGYDKTTVEKVSKRWCIVCVQCSGLVVFGEALTDDDREKNSLPFVYGHLTAAGANTTWSLTTLTINRVVTNLLLLLVCPRTAPIRISIGSSSIDPLPDKPAKTSPA